VVEKTKESAEYVKDNAEAVKKNMNKKNWFILYDNFIFITILISHLVFVFRFVIYTAPIVYGEDGCFFPVP
jgi:hypothetical protein